jgi:hypothetical protein
LKGVPEKYAKNERQYPYLQLPYLPNGTSVRAEALRLFSTQMYVSPVGKPAKSVRSIEQRSVVAGRGLSALPPKCYLTQSGFISSENISHTGEID